jgi:hypothetical protein
MGTKFKRADWNNIVIVNDFEVKKFMLEHGLKTLRMYRTCYVNERNYCDWGFTVNNFNSDYYYQQKAISTKTITFRL